MNIDTVVMFLIPSARERIIRQNVYVRKILKGTEQWNVYQKVSVRKKTERRIKCLMINTWNLITQLNIVLTWEQGYQYWIVLTRLKSSKSIWQKPILLSLRNGIGPHGEFGSD